MFLVGVNEDFVILHRDLKQTYIFNFDKRTRKEIDFNSEDSIGHAFTHKIDYGCSIKFQDTIWIFGGRYDKRKVSIVSGCGLETKTIALPAIGINIYLKYKIIIINNKIK